MKKLLCVLITVFGISLSSMVAQSKYELQKQVMRNYGYNIGAEKWADISVGNYLYSDLNFDPNYQYTIVATSNDYNVTDIDIYVYDAYGNIVAQDSDDNSLAVVNITVDYSRDFRVVVKNYASNTYYESTCRFFVAYKYR